MPFKIYRHTSEILRIRFHSNKTNTARCNLLLVEGHSFFFFLNQHLRSTIKQSHNKTRYVCNLKLLIQTSIIEVNKSQQSP